MGQWVHNCNNVSSGSKFKNKHSKLVETFNHVAKYLCEKVCDKVIPQNDNAGNTMLGGWGMMVTLRELINSLKY